MSYFSEVFSTLMDNIKDKTLYARRQSWSPDKQIRVMTGRLYGTHLAMFDQRGWTCKFSRNPRGWSPW